ncbi:MAG: 4Fe-4S dicluster domain-containing protein [Alphaproteobacteria bacterium]|nr:4Fe-4S dicluster domain-containing protein [Alphaproteobacteria bacterium]
MGCRPGHNKKISVSRRRFLRHIAGNPPDNLPATRVTVAANCLAQNGVACRLCDDICTPGAIRFRPQLGGQYHPEITSDMCTGCLRCLEVCPVGALQKHEERQHTSSPAGATGLQHHHPHHQSSGPCTSGPR